ncbi:MAG: hypothetical protein MZV64_71125 [Ignavibacteriales bacterium]|nr:hypothetical protein [Ignavibacteriales bacterium]
MKRLSQEDDRHRIPEGQQRLKHLHADVETRMGDKGPQLLCSFPVIEQPQEDSRCRTNSWVSDHGSGQASRWPLPGRCHKDGQQSRLLRRRSAPAGHSNSRHQERQPDRGYGGNPARPCRPQQPGREKKRRPVMRNGGPGSVRASQRPQS